MKKLKVYLASRWEDRDKVIEHRDFLLKNSNIESTARWLTPPHPRLKGKVANEVRTGEVIQSRDMEDIRDADVVIVFSPLKAHGNGTGGRHVECGIALGLHKPILLVGVRENVFHCNKNVINVSTTKKLLPHLKKFSKLKAKKGFVGGVCIFPEMCYDGYDDGIPPRK